MSTGLIVSFILRMRGQDLFRLFSWLSIITLVMKQEGFDGSYEVLYLPLMLVLLGIIPQPMNITLVNMSLLAEGLSPLNISLHPLSGTYSNVSNPAGEESLLGCY